MPDWRELVRQRLAGLSLQPEERDEVIAELAAHLDETFEGLRRRGFAEEDAAQRCLSEVTDWHDLRRKIQTARRRENIMSNRIMQLWLPGLLTFVISTGALALLQKFGPKPWVLARSGGFPLAVLYIPWFLSLPLIGAMGAYLSHRAGGSRRAVFSSIVFPVLPFLASILVVLPVSLIFDRFIAHNTAPMFAFMALLGWVLAPGVALIAGGLPVQLFFSRRLASRRIAGN